MKIITAKQFKQEQLASTLEENNERIDQQVLNIIQEVRKNGDQALYEYTKQFDHVPLQHITVSKDEINEAKTKVDNEFLQAIKKAKNNITRFHKMQKEDSWSIQTDQGGVLGQKITPLEKVGIYIPGGKAVYPSTVLMNAIPAKLAGVKSISIATPPQNDGLINPHVLTAADLCGVDRIYKVGGAQAIAALAYGTESIEKVMKIVGPGNLYVARAKKWVYGDVDIDMIAGPSEICIIADEQANTKFVAADLLSQAEHDEKAVSICITTSKDVAKKVAMEVNGQMKEMGRKKIIDQSLQANGRIIIVDSKEKAFKLANDIAPEHLQLMTKNATDDIQSIKNAGAIFLGNYSPEALGDYLAGPNHTLPTSGTAAYASPLGVYDFIKKSSIISYSKDALLAEANEIINIANIEGLTAHAKAIQIRKDD